MIFTLREPVGVVALIEDPQLRQARILDIDRVALVSFAINSITGVAQFGLGFGAVAPDGRFHLDPAGRLVRVTIDRRQDPVGFAACFADEAGNPRAGFPAEWLTALAKDVLFPAAYRLVWATPFPDIEIERDGVLLFKRPPMPKPPEPLPPLEPALEQPFPPPAPE